MFNVKEIPNAPEWDGHKPEDVGRLFSIDMNGGEMNVKSIFK